jgi:hypothetical protein
MPCGSCVESNVQRVKADTPHARGVRPWLPPFSYRAINAMGKRCIPSPERQPMPESNTLSTGGSSLLIPFTARQIYVPYAATVTPTTT